MKSYKNLLDICGIRRYLLFGNDHMPDPYSLNISIIWKSREVSRSQANSRTVPDAPKTAIEGSFSGSGVG